MAFRFLYLPSMGSLFILAWAIIQLAGYLDRKTGRKGIGRLFVWGFAGLCAVSTFTLNYDWKNNYALSKAWVKHYPDHPTGYKFLGLIYLDGRMEHYALPNFIKAVELDSNDPRAYYYTAVLNGDLSTEEKAALLKKALKMNPLYVAAAESLGRIYYNEKRWEEALLYLDHTLAVEPNYSAYRFMMLICNELEDNRRARLLLKHAGEHLTDKNELDVIRQLFENKTKPLSDSVK